MTVSKPNAIRRKIRKCPQKARQRQLVRLLEGQWGLSIKQIARRMKVSECSARRYVGAAVIRGYVIVNFTHQETHSKKPILYYALKRKS